ncbi:MAG: histidine phosphatase family protein [Dethiobacter sp.]|jgi:alpha-ribazole phosphatase|nr:MAG: histidine phosphatase family protein [Dethiobacter sp.]
MKIYLVRHGLTSSNKEKRYVGWKDVDLSPQGYRQAEKLAHRFISEPFTALYSSDLTRAVKTAEIIGKRHGLKPVTTSMLREIHFGDWEGLTYGEIMNFSEDEMRRWFDNPFQYSPPGGESLMQVYSRMEQFLTFLPISSENNGSIVLVSHGGAIRSVLHHYMGLAAEKIWDLTIENTSVSLLNKSKARVEVVFVNDLSHLED